MEAVASKPLAMEIISNILPPITPNYVADIGVTYSIGRSQFLSADATCATTPNSNGLVLSLCGWNFGSLGRWYRKDLWKG